MRGVCVVCEWGGGEGVWVCVCLSVYIYADSRAQKETRSVKRNQELDSMSAKKPGARDRERKSAKFKAQKKSAKAPA